MKMIPNKYSYLGAAVSPLAAAAFTILAFLLSFWDLGPLTLFSTLAIIYCYFIFIIFVIPIYLLLKFFNLLTKASCIISGGLIGSIGTLFLSSYMHFSSTGMVEFIPILYMPIINSRNLVESLEMFVLNGFSGIAGGVAFWYLAVQDGMEVIINKIAPRPPKI